MRLDSYDVHPLGKGFVVASAATAGVAVAAFAADGSEIDSITLPIDGPVVGDVALNATAALDAALVAWAEADGNGSVIHVARIRCSD